MKLIRRALARFRSASSRTRALLAIAALILGLNVVLAGLGALYPSPSGPPSSSYATAPEGVAAYADLLARNGHTVRRLRAGPSDESLDPAATVVLLDPEVLLPQEAEALRRFVERGGRLVAGGPTPTWLNSLLDSPPEWSDEEIDTAEPLAPVAETAGVSTVDAEGAGAWSAPGGTLPVIGTPADALVVVADVGKGRVALLGDSSPLQNRLLDASDNAALGLALAGAPGRPVGFVESVHGYGGERGLAALPTRWKWALAGLALAGLIAIAARGRRLGPPEDAARALPPPRRAYVDAVASLLARTKRPAETRAAVRAAARERLAARAGIDPATGGAELEQAAVRLGLPPEERRALSEEGDRDGDEDLLAAGRALARLTGDRR